jgi:hypothetical protein
MCLAPFSFGILGSQYYGILGSLYHGILGSIPHMYDSLDQ